MASKSKRKERRHQPQRAGKTESGELRRKPYEPRQIKDRRLGAERHEKIVPRSPLQWTGSNVRLAAISKSARDLPETPQVAPNRHHTIRGGTLPGRDDHRDRERSCVARRVRRRVMIALKRSGPGGRSQGGGECR